MKWVVFALGFAFIGTNALWFYKSVDHGVTNMYREQICTEHEEALEQSLATIRLVKRHLARKEILAAAHSTLPQFGEPFEKDGELNAGRLAFKLDQSGNVTEVRLP